MAMGSLSDNEDDFNPEINTTPLVDVMLVLLIIFIITIPVMNHSVKIDLPQATTQPDDVKPDHISLSIDENGIVRWGEDAVDPEQLAARIVTAAQKTPQPELHLQAARTVQYDKVAKVMAAAHNGGLTKIGFVTEPESK